VQLAALKEHLNFYISASQKCTYDGLKSMLEIEIQIKLNLVLFGRIQILQEVMAVPGVIFHAPSQIGILVIANLSEMNLIIFHLWMHCLTDSISLKWPIFKQKKESVNLGLVLIY
jgi:hypothetical protein